MSGTSELSQGIPVERLDPPRSAGPLAVHVKECLERYFDELNGQPPSHLYDLVLTELEQPLLEVVMTKTRGNLSKAAAFLGLNRATLRKKLKKYGIEN
ncbi:MAG: DNA-binding transcriptional regulator Fis [Proteobacteria bacterium]|nr:DNA-binding transcriptional regulator Fis [Pseudomonadota bacterium]